MVIKVLEDGILLHVRLAPGASRNKIGGIVTNAEGKKQLRIMVTAIPEKGKANKALIKLLSKALQLPKSAFEIISGEISRNKTLEIKGNASHLKHLLETVFAGNNASVED